MWPFSKRNPVSYDLKQRGLESFAENPARCSDCGSKNFYGGPEGGLSQNVKCVDCGSEFNVTWFYGRIISVERIRQHPPAVETQGG
jgi:DNA-directed RNA polymerase subunit RPC12/RpoP